MNMRQLAFGLLSLVVVLPAQADEAVPRYRFKVGQVVGMRSTTESRHSGRGDGNETEWTAWVIRANPDGDGGSSSAPRLGQPLWSTASRNQTKPSPT